MKNFGDIQKLAQKMQADMAKAQEELGAMTVEGSAGGGAVVVVMTGTQECKEVRIKKEAVDPDDVETLEDLMRAATTDALAKSKQLAADKLSGLTGGLKLPGMGLRNSPLASARTPRRRGLQTAGRRGADHATPPESHA